jgi:hypothetical protein
MQTPKSVPKAVSKSREIGGFVLGTLTFMLGALALGYAALWIFAPADASPPDTSALTAKLEVASSDQTAITAKLENLKAFRLEPTQFFEPRSWSNSEANRLIDEYKPDLANFEAFSRLERVVSVSRDPKLSTFELSYNSSLSNKSLLNIAKLADLMLVRAELKGRSSDPKGFFDDLLIVARAAKLERDAGGTITEYLIGSKMLRSTLKRLRAGMLSLDMKPNEWKSRLDALASLNPNVTELQDTVKTEFRLQQLAIQDAMNNPRAVLKTVGIITGENSMRAESLSLLLPTRYNFQTNTTLGWFTDYSNGIVKANASCPPDEKVFERVSKIFQNQTRNIFAPNIVGRSLFAYLIPMGGLLLNAHCKLASDFAATVTVAALRGFQLESKDLPKRLAELEGKFLTKIPVDPFSGNPLELNLQRRVLQSKSGATFKLGF